MYSPNGKIEVGQDSTQHDKTVDKIVRSDICVCSDSKGKGPRSFVFLFVILNNYS